MSLDVIYVTIVLIIAGLFLIGVIFRVVAQVIIQANEEDLKSAIEEAITPEELNQARQNYERFQAAVNPDKTTRRPR